jgi:hypothetical protein
VLIAEPTRAAVASRKACGIRHRSSWRRPRYTCESGGPPGQEPHDGHQEDDPTPAQARKEAERATARLAKAEAAVTDARTARNLAMKAMHDAGASYAEVGAAVGVSPMAARAAVLNA